MKTDNFFSGITDSLIPNPGIENTPKPMNRLRNNWLRRRGDPYTGFGANFRPGGFWVNAWNNAFVTSICLSLANRPDSLTDVHARTKTRKHAGGKNAKK